MPKFGLYFSNDEETQYLFYCPGCENHHSVRVKGKGSWTVTGLETDCPTVHPSILSKTGLKICHLFIKNGKIEYLRDCTHSLAGKTVDIPDFEE
jgi:hypothetical protein